MSETDKPANGKNGLWKQILAALAAVALGGGTTFTGVTAVKSDAARQSLETRLAVMEVLASDREKKIDNLMDQVRTIASVLAVVPLRIDELARKTDEALIRVDKLDASSREARKEMRAEFNEQIDRIERRFEGLQRQLGRLNGSSAPVGPVRPPPMIDGDVSAEVAPFGAPGATEGLRR